MPSAEAWNAERRPEKPLSVSPRQQASGPGPGPRLPTPPAPRAAVSREVRTSQQL